MLLLVQALAVYQLVFRAHGRPSFRRGGSFVIAGTNGRPVPYAAAEGDALATSTTAPPAAVGPSSEPSTPGSVPDDASGDVTAAATAAEPALLPAVATYTYAVAGSERATGFGGRAYPATMTFDVHASPDLDATEVVADLQLSEDHQEREILQRTPDGLAFAFEGGSITFGPGTQTSEADYDPPMLQVPATLTPGFTASGTSTARNSDGSTSRVEDWTIAVVGQETVDVGGTPVDTRVIDLHRATRPGSSDQVDRQRRYWYDPVRALWVRWHETFHGARDVTAFTFTYDTEYTATLTALPNG